jgi:hypothetical protein
MFIGHYGLALATGTVLTRWVLPLFGWRIDRHRAVA